MRTTLVAAALALVVTAGTSAPAKSREATNPYPGYSSATYADPAHWLCRPDKDDVCDTNMDATSIKANGKAKVERFRPAKKPKIDCFYVYPTISTDMTGNSDLVPGDDQELFVVRQQAARLGTVCRVFAPVYRQITLNALLGILGTGGGPSFDRDLAYNDVADAWKHYVANDNQGRGVVLIGHSQGAGVLTELIEKEIDQVPALRERLVSAILLGTSLQVPSGADVGGDFKNIPLCRSKKQTGCAITYGSFRSTVPPPSNTLFGRSSGPGLEAACTNPANLAGGSGTLHPYLPADGKSLPILAPPSTIDWGAPVSTPFVALPDFISSRCAEHDGFHYLELTVHGNPADPRIDDIGGDITAQWGMHLVDANVAMGDLVTITKSQAKAFGKKGKSGKKKPASPMPY
jgi:hypothetical protein